MLSKPYPASSRGNSSAGRNQTPRRSRTVLLYSARFSRCEVTRPGSDVWGDRPSNFSIHAVTAATSGFRGAGDPGGGIRPELTLSSTFSQIAAERPGFSRLRFAVFTLSLWQAKQFFARKGRTRAAYSDWAMSCAAAVQHATAPTNAANTRDFAITIHHDSIGICSLAG